MEYTISNLLDKTHKGWVNVDIDGIRQNICYNTTAILLEQKDEFELVEISDGPFIGKIAKVPYKKKSGGYRISYLEEDKKSRSSLIIRYDLKKKELFFLDFKLMAIHSNALPIGTYCLLIPRYLHDKSRKYTSESDGGSRFAETWFQIESSNNIVNDFFVHFGSVTDGCITVVDSGKLWTKIYLHLMNNRMNDRSVALLEVY